MSKEKLSRGAALYGKIVSNEGTAHDFAELFSLLFVTLTSGFQRDSESMFNYYKREWEESVRRLYDNSKRSL